MKLNHLNLIVTDVLGTKKLLEKHFGLRPDGGNDDIAFLTDDNGIVLTLTSMKLAKETHVTYPNAFHIGFLQENEEQVNEINRRLKKDGYDVPPPSRQHASWTFYFQAPGGFMIEVFC